MGALDRWFALERAERRMTLQVAPVVAQAVLRVRLLPVKRALAWAEIPVGPLSEEGAEYLASAVDRAARYVPGASCLARSLALARLLRRRGVPANVRIGVTTDPAFAAHAWVVLGAPRELRDAIRLGGLRDDLDLELHRYVPMDLDRDR